MRDAGQRHLDLFAQLHWTERLAHERLQILPGEVDGIGIARYEYNRQERPANSGVACEFRSGDARHYHVSQQDIDRLASLEER